MKALAARSGGDDLSRLCLGFSRAYDDVARSAQPRAAFEMALVRLAQRPPLLPLDDLIRRLAELEQRLDGHGGGAGPSAGGTTGTGRPGRCLRTSPARSNRYPAAEDRPAGTRSCPTRTTLRSTSGTGPRRTADRRPGHAGQDPGRQGPRQGEEFIRKETATASSDRPCLEGCQRPPSRTGRRNGARPCSCRDGLGNDQLLIFPGVFA